MTNETGLSVSELNLIIAEAVRRDPRTRSVLVRGEVSSFRNQIASGHWYFSLKDAQASITCAMFRNANLKAKIRPKDGDQVLAEGYVDFYSPQGKIQLIVTGLRPAGIGDMYIKLEELKRKLAAEGLFDESRKRQLPMKPRKVAVVTSQSGAALQDILNVSALRCPAVPIVLVPVPVQGEGAGKEIAEGIRKANEQTDADVIIVARGGGSAEDLWCFNDELVARAVAASRVPVVSGVGHEIDTTLCDLAADARASTPSNAAEMVFPDSRELQGRVDLLRSGLGRAYLGILRQAELAVSSLAQRLTALSPEKRIALLLNQREMAELKLRGALGARLEKAGMELKDTGAALKLAVSDRLKDAAHTAARLRERLAAVSPLAVLDRGYALVYDTEEKLLTRAAEAGRQQEMTLQFADGRVAVTRKGTT
ncbi:MAG: exodeoxyribonuclease VII large subunit [Clostridia bacterium]|nr:exodeoxyribonuclease VII large subunit [Clostridia bacterium]